MIERQKLLTGKFWTHPSEKIVEQDWRQISDAKRNPIGQPDLNQTHHEGHQRQGSVAWVQVAPH